MAENPLSPLPRLRAAQQDLDAARLRALCRLDAISAAESRQPAIDSVLALAARVSPSSSASASGSSSSLPYPREDQMRAGALAAHHAGRE